MMQSDADPLATRPDPAAPLAQQTPRGAPSAAWPIGVFLVLASAIFAIYYATTDAPFIFDDVPCIENNPSIMQLWPPLGTKESPGPLRPPQDFNTAGRPLVNLSLAINVALDGLNPFGFHLFNMLVHALNATLLWAIVRRALCLEFFNGRFARKAAPLAFLMALVWALHPLQTESVQYVSQRTELLMGFCYLAVMYASLRYFTAQGDRTGWLLLATLAGAAGMACKEVMVSAPAMVLLFDRTFISGSFFRALRSSWPLYVGLLLDWGLLLALNVGGPRSASAGFHLDVSAQAWWLTQCKVLLMYLKLTVWPWPLVIHYEFPYMETLTAAWPWVLAVAGLALLTIILVWRRAAAGFLCVWIVAILSPTLVVPIITEIAVERRMYLPLIAPVAFFIVGGYALLQMLADRRGARAARSSASRWPIVVTAGAVLACSAGFAVLDVRRLAAYEDPLTLWEDAYAHQPENYYVHVNYGFELLNQGRAEEALEQLELALKISQEDGANIHAVMGKAHLIAKRPAEAKKHLEEALRLRPDFPEARGNLGHVLLHEYSNVAEAMPHLQESLRVRPDSLEIRHDMGLALINSGRSVEAIEWLEPVVRLKPNSAEAHRDMGLALGNAGRLKEAIPQFEEALRLKLDTAELHQYLGVALVNTGKNQSAIEQFERALVLDPKSADAHYFLGIAHFNAGRPRDAITEFERTLSLKPDHASAKAALERAKEAAARQ